MDPGFSLSQPSSSQSTNNPQVFVDAIGTPCPIFVESNGIRDNRPKLIRTLRNHGARICVDISLARIILVEPHSREGRQFVRDWEMDPGKVVLDVAWVRRSLEAGRALLENSNWGGCGNLDGVPVEDDAANDDESGLFTHNKAFVLNGEDVNSFVSVPPQTPTVQSSSNGPRSSALPAIHPPTIEHEAPASPVQTSQNAIAPLRRLSTPPSSGALAQIPPPMPSQPPQFPPNMVASQQQNMPPLSMMPPYGQLVPQSQFPVYGLNPQVLQAIMSNPEMAQLFMSMMVTQGMSPNGPLMPTGWQGQAPQGFIQVPPGFQMVQQVQPQQPVPMSPPSVNGHSESASHAIRDESKKAEHQSSRQSSSPLPTFTAYNESESDSPPPDQSILGQRGKKRQHDSPSSASSKPSKRSRSPSTSHSKKNERKRSSLSTEHIISEHAPLKSEKSPPIGIFTSKDGAPMAFFVQVQMRNRQSVVKQIKSNGGRLVADPYDADFILLDTRPGRERETWMKSVKDLKRFALRPGFIEACINSNGLVEEADFVIESVKKGGKGKKKAPPRQSEKGSVESEEKESPLLSRQSSQTHIAGSPTPSPPPISQLASSAGRSSFTQEEIDYCYAFTQHLCRKNPSISYSQIANELAARAPRHPAVSWANILYREQPTWKNLVRQEVTNEEHSGSSFNVPSGSQPEVEAQLIQPVDAKVVQPSATANNDETEPENRIEKDRSTLREADLKTITDFFANPPKGVTEDDALWIAINQGYKCWTALSWQEFYEENLEVVNQHLREALEMPPADTTAGQ